MPPTATKTTAIPTKARQEAARFRRLQIKLYEGLVKSHEAMNNWLLSCGEPPLGTLYFTEHTAPAGVATRTE